MHLAVVDPAEFMHHSAVAANTPLESVLSTMYTTVDSALLQPAHGHSQPLFGPPDPLLSSGHSIAPNIKAVLGSDAVATANTAIEEIPQAAKAAIQNGQKVFDASNFEVGGGKTLPGFFETGGIMKKHSSDVPEASLQSLTSQVKQSAKLFPALDKFPMAAFALVFIDFFFLRRGEGLYKEDIEEKPFDVAVQTLVVTGVRLVAFAITGLVTIVLFSG